MAVIALDVGGTTIKGAVVDDHGVQHREQFSTSRGDGPDAVVGAITAAARSLIIASGETDIAAAGVVVPGLIDEQAGVGTYSVNIGWRDLPLRRVLEEQLGLAVAFGHDVRAAAVAEAELGAAAGAASALFVAIGTGIAGALVVDGSVIAGANGHAGELGQLLVSHPDTGDPVRLEEVASAHAIGVRYGSDDASAVVAAAAAGDSRAAKIWNDAVIRLANVLADAVAVVDPATIVIGGGLSRAGDALLLPLRARLTDRLPWRAAPTIVCGRLLDDAGWVGAALLALRLAGEKSKWAGLDRS